MNPDESSRARALLDRLAQHVPNDTKTGNVLSELGVELERMHKQSQETAELVKAYEDAYAKLTSPANKVGVYVADLEEGHVLLAMGDSEMVALVDPTLDRASLVPGVRVALNEAYAVIAVLPQAELGALLKVGQVMEDGRLRVGTDLQGQSGRLVRRSPALEKSVVKVGDEVRLDPSGRFAVELFGQREAQDYFMEQVEPVAWESIGGQSEAISLIRETIEHPLLYPELYRKFDKKPVKGILLYGPPGCGKTLIGKATAYNLAKDYSQRVGREVKEYFMHISGPKILNMWLGETERMVREVFATARERAKEGRLVVIFIDEAESLLRTRSSGRWLNISNTVVPQFCAEMDGLVSLENVVLIVTSNRPDYIDPAVLRPERIDRKVKVSRPDRDSTREVLELYLHDRLPIDSELLAEHKREEDARRFLIDSTLAHLWRATKDTQFLKVFLHNGTTQVLHWRDLVSGALVKSVVDRAKDAAIRRAIADPGGPHGLRESDLHEAVASEYRENEIFPKSDAVEDWLKLLDLEPESVATVKPIRTSKGDGLAKRDVI